MNDRQSEVSVVVVNARRQSDQTNRQSASNSASLQSAISRFINWRAEVGGLIRSNHAQRAGCTNGSEAAWLLMALLVMWVAVNWSHCEECCAERQQ
jgi:hypothetical protein